MTDHARSRSRGLVCLAVLGLPGVLGAQCFPWNPALWAPVEPLALCSWDDGSGRALYVGASGGGVLRWLGGSSYAPVGALHGLDMTTHVASLVGFDDGSGPKLYASGHFSLSPIPNLAMISLARWDGSGWSSFGGGVEGHVAVLEAFDDGSGPALYAAGNLTGAGGTPVGRIARWDGAAWSPLGSGLAGGVGPTPPGVLDLEPFDDGSGPALYAAGNFTLAGGAPAGFVARWDGAAWSSVGPGLTRPQEALHVHDDGSGPALYATGHGAEVVRWDGASWTTIGGPSAPGLFGSYGLDLETFDDGGGPKLWVAGELDDFAGIAQADTLAIWDGSGWSTVEDEVEDYVYVLGTHDAGSGAGASLFVGGTFHRAGGIYSARLAERRPCLAAGTAFCTGELPADCPCDNVGGLGRGCANASPGGFYGGALLVASGATTPDEVVLAVENVPSAALSIFLQGDSAIAPTAFGDGLRCVGGALRRLYVESALGGVAYAPQAGEASITARSAALGDAIAPGSTRHYQVYYRHPDPAFCPAPAGDTFNASNGRTIVW